MLSNRDRQTLIEDFSKIFVTKDEFSSWKNEVMTGLDAVMGELKTMREEITLFAYRHADHSDRIETLEAWKGRMEEKLKAKF